MTGRVYEARPGDINDLAATTLLRMSLHEAAAKVRHGGPEDDEADLAWDAWAGVVPLAHTYGAPVPAPGIAREVPAGVRAPLERNATIACASIGAPSDRGRPGDCRPGADVRG